MLERNEFCKMISDSQQIASPISIESKIVETTPIIATESISSIALTSTNRSTEATTTLTPNKIKTNLKTSNILLPNIFSTSCLSSSHSGSSSSSLLLSPSPSPPFKQKLQAAMYETPLNTAITDATSFEVSSPSSSPSTILSLPKCLYQQQQQQQQPIKSILCKQLNNNQHENNDKNEITQDYGDSGVQLDLDKNESSIATVTPTSAAFTRNNLNNQNITTNTNQTQQQPIITLFINNRKLELNQLDTKNQLNERRKLSNNNITNHSNFINFNKNPIIRTNNEFSSIKMFEDKSQTSTATTESECITTTSISITPTTSSASTTSSNMPASTEILSNFHLITQPQTQPERKISNASLNSHSSSAASCSDSYSNYSNLSATSINSAKSNNGIANQQQIHCCCYCYHLQNPHNFNTNTTTTITTTTGINKSLLSPNINYTPKTSQAHTAHRYHHHCARHKPQVQIVINETQYECLAIPESNASSLSSPSNLNEQITNWINNNNNSTTSASASPSPPVASTQVPKSPLLSSLIKSNNLVKTLAIPTNNDAYSSCIYSKSAPDIFENHKNNNNDKIESSSDVCCSSNNLKLTKTRSSKDMCGTFDKYDSYLNKLSNNESNINDSNSNTNCCLLNCCCHNNTINTSSRSKSEAFLKPNILNTYHRHLSPSDNMLSNQQQIHHLHPNQCDKNSFCSLSNEIILLGNNDHSANDSSTNTNINMLTPYSSYCSICENSKDQQQQQTQQQQQQHTTDKQEKSAETCCCYCCREGVTGSFASLPEFTSRNNFKKSQSPLTLAVCDEHQSNEPQKALSSSPTLTSNTINMIQSSTSSSSICKSHQQQQQDKLADYQNKTDKKTTQNHQKLKLIKSKTENCATPTSSSSSNKFFIESELSSSSNSQVNSGCDLINRYFDTTLAPIQQKKQLIQQEQQSELKGDETLKVSKQQQQQHTLQASINSKRQTPTLATKLSTKLSKFVNFNSASNSNLQLLPQQEQLKAFSSLICNESHQHECESEELNNKFEKLKLDKKKFIKLAKTNPNFIKNSYSHVNDVSTSTNEATSTSARLGSSSSAGKNPIFDLSFSYRNSNDSEIENSKQQQQPQQATVSNTNIKRNDIVKSSKKNSKSTSALDSLVVKSNVKNSIDNKSKQTTNHNHHLHHYHNNHKNSSNNSPRFFKQRNNKTQASNSNNDDNNNNNNNTAKSRATTIAKDIKSKASNLLKRRHTETSFGDKSYLPSKEEVSKWQTAFENLLRHKYGVALFRGFLKTEFSDENIEFWLACEDYKNTDKEPKLQAKAKKIYLEFVAIGSPREVNLDIELRMHTADNIANPTLDSFDRAQKRIQVLMEKDSYPRFLESDLYRNFCSSYNTNTMNANSVSNISMNGKTT